MAFEAAVDAAIRYSDSHMPKPEEKARQRIDELLGQAGWVIQDRDQMDLGAALGVAVRVFQLPAGPPATTCCSSIARRPRSSRTWKLRWSNSGR